MSSKNFSYRKLIIKFVFPLILLFWPLINVAEGVNLVDSAYSLGNYMFFNDMASSWKYATYLSNLVGYVFCLLCGGKLLAMNILTGLIVSGTMLTVYLSMRNEINPVILFLSGIVAESLCWCPTVILYNYLTYLFLTAAAVVIYKAIANNNKPMYFIAGVLLGLNLFVRISNAVEVLLICAVWVGIALYKGKGKKAKWIKPTLLCIGGYSVGAVLIIVLMAIVSGTSGIIDAFTWAIGLFSASEDAGGYSAGGMLSTIAQNYLSNAKWFAILAVAIFFGIAGFSVLKDKLILLKKIGYTLCVVILFIWFERNGVFNIYYRNTGAIFGLSVIFILCQFVILFYTAFNKDTERNEKLLAYISIIILLITPLGSNNHLFTIINNMFFVMPISVWLFIQIVKPYYKEPVMYPALCVMSALTIVYFVQAIFFHTEYSFKDGENGEERNCKIDVECVYKGMYTNEANARLVEELVLLNNIKEIENADGLILYGNIPGAAYLLEKSAIISTTWPDLDSYSLDTLEDDLLLLSQSSDNKAVVIINNAALDEEKIKKDDKYESILKYTESFKNKYIGNDIIAYY